MPAVLREQKVSRVARDQAHGLQNTGLAMIIKQRIKANEIERMDLADCIIVDV